VEGVIIAAENRNRRLNWPMFGRMT